LIALQFIMSLRKSTYH